MNKIKYLIISFIATFVCLSNVNAASGSIVASSSTKTAVVGSTFTVSVKVSCSEALGSWQYGISYDNQYISLQSGDTNVASYGDGSTKTKTYTYKFKAIKSGSASVRVTGASMVSWNDVNTLFTPSVTNAKVTVKTQAEIEASYSKDNNLKSLKVEGFELSPQFDKNTTEYSVTVPDDITSIKVIAQENDSTASVHGTGTIDISEGANKIDVVVTAQNGSVKTYTILVEVKDLNPIKVNLENKDFTVVKKETLLTCPTGYTPTTIKINDLDIPSFKSDLTGFILIGLKDETGNIALYIYDSEQKSYTIYNEIKDSSLTLYPMSAVEVLKGFSKGTASINGVEFEAFINDLYKNIKLIYAMNVETGETDYYMLDEETNSFIKYDFALYDDFIAKTNELKIYLYALSGVTILILLIALILTRKNSKLKKLLIKVTSKRDEVTEESLTDIVEEAPIDDSIEKEDDDSLLDVKKKKKKNRK